MAKFIGGTGDIGGIAEHIPGKIMPMPGEVIPVESPMTATEAVLRDAQAPLMPPPLTPTPPPAQPPSEGEVFKVGDEVIVIEASHGWAEIRPNNRGTVHAVNEQTILVNFPNRNGPWTGTRACFRSASPRPGDIVTQVSDVKEGEDAQVEIISIRGNEIEHRHLNRKTTNRASASSFNFALIDRKKTEAEERPQFGLGDRVGTIIKHKSISGIIEKINREKREIGVRSDSGKLFTYKEDKIKLIKERPEDYFIAPEPNDRVMLRKRSKYIYQSRHLGTVIEIRRAVYFNVKFDDGYRNAYASNELDIILKHPDNIPRRRKTKQIIEIKEENNTENSDTLYLSKEVYKQIYRVPRDGDRAEVWLLGGHGNKADYILPLLSDGGCSSAPHIKKEVIAPAIQLMIATGRSLLGFICLRHHQIRMVEDIESSGTMEYNILTWRIQYPNCYIISIGKTSNEGIIMAEAYQLRTPVAHIKLQVGNIVEHITTKAVHKVRKASRKIIKKRR